jgi:hypothetical protein
MVVDAVSFRRKAIQGQHGLGEIVILIDGERRPVIATAVPTDEVRGIAENRGF